MIRTRTVSLNEASLIAVAALDELVFELVRASQLKLSPAFLDWVADEATPLVEREVARSFHTPRFAGSLRRSDHRLALAHWVRQWVCPRIAACFSNLAVHLPVVAGRMPEAQPPHETRAGALHPGQAWGLPRAVCGFVRAT